MALTAPAADHWAARWNTAPQQQYMMLEQGQPVHDVSNPVMEYDVPRSCAPHEQHQHEHQHQQEYQHYEHRQHTSPSPHYVVASGTYSASAMDIRRTAPRTSPRRSKGPGFTDESIKAEPAPVPVPAPMPEAPIKPTFSTQVDLLMRTIQTRSDDEALSPARSASPMPMQAQTPISMQMSTTTHDEEYQKPYPCDAPGCTMKFWQRTHLEIHRRSHTGEKPYVCRFAGCGTTFSQLGNLRTHERRHTGEKPFKCERCDKYFAQRANLKAHHKTHLREQPFQCRLDNCTKRFTQLGNMKAHQNKYHGAVLQALTDKFAAAAAGDAAAAARITDADRALLAYFSGLYKNSNKGIKGRGKHRRVRPLNVPPGGLAVRANDAASVSMSSSASASMSSSLTGTIDIRRSQSHGTTSTSASVSPSAPALAMAMPPTRATIAYGGLYSPPHQYQHHPQHQHQHQLPPPPTNPYSVHPQHHPQHAPHQHSPQDPRHPHQVPSMHHSYSVY